VTAPWVLRSGCDCELAWDSTFLLRPLRQAAASVPAGITCSRPCASADLTVLDEVLDRVATATRRILELGPAAAMNEFNRRERNGLAEE